jgi:hypothetical protein
VAGIVEGTVEVAVAVLEGMLQAPAGDLPERCEEY